MKVKYIVRKNDNYLNINDVLNLEFKISSRLKLKLIKNNCILLNGTSCDTRLKVKENDIITVNFDYEEANSNIVPKKMNLNIIYEDDWLLAIDKPAGFATHPSILHYKDSISNGVKYYFDKIGLKKKIRPINRLDLNTSGLIIFAKCEYIQDCLNKQMQNRNFVKEYLALASGIFKNKKGTINLPIARKEGSIIERCISSCGQPSITHYEVLEESNTYSLIKCTLETGRTHQIRVHMASFEHPLIGDTLYGNSSNLIDRHALHCYKLKFIHPITKKRVNLVAQLPEDMNSLIISRTHIF
ncbi:MAG: RluA family pseudouridine synthase [Clostridia bacterium]|nr:RluA family pseudouridine synthase [Clostridia bacterium]